MQRWKNSYNTPRSTEIRFRAATTNSKQQSFLRRYHHQITKHTGLYGTPSLITGLKKKNATYPYSKPVDASVHPQFLPLKDQL